MSNDWRKWAALGALAVVAVLLVNLGSGVTTATTTYSVNMKEIGLPTGTSWSAVFNGVTSTGTGSSQVFTGLSAGTYCWNYEQPVPGTATTTRYMPYTYSGCTTIPNQLTVTDSYVEQTYLNFAVTPTSAGSTTPGSNWYTTGSTLAISASATYGYSFTKWTATPASALTLSNITDEASALTITATGTVTAHFLATKSKVTFNEVGLPSGTSWTVVFGGTSYLGATSSISTGTHAPTSYSWNVPSVSAAHGVSYTPSPASGGITVPYQPSQEIVFVKQFAVTLAVSPSGSGTIAPGAGSYVWTNNSNVPVTALDSSTYVFSSWVPSIAGTFGIQSRTTAGTNVTVLGSGTLTAKFVTGTECTTCKMTFMEVGLPLHAGWGVTFGGVQYSTTSSSITLTGLTTSQYWSAFDPVGGTAYGVQYVPNSYSSGGYWYLGETNSTTIVYQKEAYVTVQGNPYFSGGGWTASTGWYYVGSQFADSAINSATYKFSSWTASGTNLTLSAGASSSTAVTVKGPATLNVNFVPTYSTVRFLEFGLPAGTTWGADINGQWFWASTPWINVSGVQDADYGWAASNTISGGAGIQWDSPTTGGGINVPYQTMISVVYTEAYQVTFAAGGTAGGAVTPSGTAWYYTGTIVPIYAENGTSVTFSSWGKTTTSGTITLSSSTVPSTYATIKGTGTVTATFA
jgi:hypothetical protein